MQFVSRRQCLLALSAPLMAPAAAQHGGDLVIGQAVPLSGVLASSGEQIVKGVQLCFEQVGDRLRMELHDDGCGFDPAQPVNRALGLLSMRERAREIGGELSISSAPGYGTQLALSAPLL